MLPTTRSSVPARARCRLVSLLICAAAAHAAPSRQPAAPAQPVEPRLLARYTDLLKALRDDLVKVVPAASAQRKASLQQAREALKQAEAEARAAQQRLGAVQTAKALVEHAKGKWIGGAEKGLAQAEAALKKAATDAEREAARKDLAKWQANKEDGLKALRERQAAYDAAKVDEPRLTQAHQEAQAALTRARARELDAAKALLADLEPFLASEQLDEPLVKAAVLANATPLGLAQFAQQGREQEALLEALLGDRALMTAMLTAGGASDGHYGQAMRIYTDILRASTRAATGNLQRLALATALQHAVPVEQRNAVAAKDAPTVVDPVKRYQHYEQAYLAGELDAAFPQLTAWELRRVVDCDAPDEVLSWGRAMLRDYRPDHILNADYGWRYSASVRTDVAYRHSQEYTDTDSLDFYPNIIKNGGICGRRAWFGGFMLRAFGIPSVRRPQPGHAALAHWTPAGWVVNLGAGWGTGSVENRPDTDFLLETQARRYPREYAKVLRAQWVADVLGERKLGNAKDAGGSGWRALALYEQQAIVAAGKPATLGPLGQELGEANESLATKAAAVEKATVTPADKQLVTGPDGVITIPAGACGGAAQPVKSFLGGLQLVCGAGPFQCQVDVPRAGRYTLTARVVTVHGELRLPLTVNASAPPVELELPYTVGRWQRTKPVTLTLAQGRNTLSFAPPKTSFAVKDFTLTPAP